MNAHTCTRTYHTYTPHTHTTYTPQTYHTHTIHTYTPHTHTTNIPHTHTTNPYTHHKHTTHSKHTHMPHTCAHTHHRHPCTLHTTPHILNQGFSHVTVSLKSVEWAGRLESLRQELMLLSRSRIYSSSAKRLFCIQGLEEECIR